MSYVNRESRTSSHPSGSCRSYGISPSAPPIMQMMPLFDELKGLHWSLPGLSEPPERNKVKRV